MSKGLFIAFEGGEGSGKSTQALMLHNHLLSQGKKSYLTREPGGTKAGEEIRNIIFNDKYDIDSITDLLLYASSRRDHIKKILKPKLETYDYVICDRYLLSSLVYQGMQVKEEKILDLYKNFVCDGIGDFYPDINIIIDTSAKVSVQRLGVRNNLNKVDKLHLSFHEQIRERYKKIKIPELNREFSNKLVGVYANMIAYHKIINGDRDINVIHDEIKTEMDYWDSFLKRKLDEAHKTYKI